jgi:TrmH family RNA methyltransferase
MEQISSAHNPSLKLARKLLKSQRERRRAGKILLDGVHLISSYSGIFGLTDAVILVRNSSVDATEIRALVDMLPTDVRVLEIPDAMFQDISPVDTPSGIIALVNHPNVPGHIDGKQFVLALDGIQDPGNLGSILRTAAATNVDEVLLSDTCTDPWSPKCLRGGMGAQFVLPVTEQVDLAGALRNFQGLRVATSSHSGQSLVETNLSTPSMVLIGGEGAGLGTELVASTDLTVRIPMKESIESLNVGAAVAMICYEHLRRSMTHAS